jgi:hypothetical protein
MGSTGSNGSADSLLLLAVPEKIFTKVFKVFWDFFPRHSFHTIFVNDDIIT